MTIEDQVEGEDQGDLVEDQGEVEDQGDLVEDGIVGELTCTRQPVLIVAEIVKFPLSQPVAKMFSAIIALKGMMIPGQEEVIGRVVGTEEAEGMTEDLDAQILKKDKCMKPPVLSAIANVKFRFVLQAISRSFAVIALVTVRARILAPANLIYLANSSKN